MLWNKSKALNYGIRIAASDFILTADVDLLFTSNFIDTVISLQQQNSFSLFKIGYLSQRVSNQLEKDFQFDTISTTHIGDTFGIGLYPKSVIEHVRGYDEFFHFYGSEDVDLNSRVELSGATLHTCDKLMLYHQWHSRYPQRKDDRLTIQPRLTNILRINQRHFLEHQRLEVVKPNTKNWGSCLLKKDLEILSHPNHKVKLNSIASHVVHYFEEELPRLKEGVYKIIIEEDPYYTTLKYSLKQWLGKQSQPYFSMKQVNDLVLSHILFRYRDKNYSYVVSKDLKRICFTIDLDS